MFLDIWKKNKLKFKQLDRDVDATALVLVSLFLLSGLIVPSVKIFFVFSFLFFGALIFFYSFPKAIVYSMLPMAFLEIGQRYSFLIIPSSSISSAQYVNGRHLFFELSPLFIILLVASFFLPIFMMKLKIKFEFATYEKLIFILLGLFCLSAFGFAPIPILSILFTIKEFLVVVWALYLIFMSYKLTAIDQQRLIITLSIIFILTLGFEMLIVLGQMFNEAPLGLLIEKTQITPVFGLGAEEQMRSFRPFGLHFHPNALANEQLLVGSTVLVLLQFFKMKQFYDLKKKLALIVISLVALSAMLSLSRSVWLALIISIIIFWIRHPKIIKNFIYELNKYLFKLSLFVKFSFLLAAGLVFLRSQSRLINSIYSFTETGGVNTRISQLSEAFSVFIKFPFFGVGSNMFIPMSYQLFPNGVMSYFPENIHNGLVLFLVERGAIASGVYLLFFLGLIQAVKKNISNKLTKTVIYLSILTGLVIMLFHPFINLLSINILITILMVHYEKKSQKKLA